MQLQKFFEQVDKHPDLFWARHPDYHTGEIMVAHSKALKAVHGITFDCIKKHNWAELCDVLTEKREIAVLRHVTRICGYFSTVQSWNKSKLGELRDRQAGNYSVPESETGSTKKKKQAKRKR